MLQFLLTGILIGLCFGVPVGAVGAMTAHRTLNYDIKAGLLTGLGASAADCIYASVGAFSLTFISEFLLKYQTFIHVFGGILIAGMGLQLLFKRNEGDAAIGEKAGRICMFLTAFAVGITNPAAILTFLFAFSWFGIVGKTEPVSGTALVCGVFIGTYAWWILLSWAVTMLKRKAKINYLQRINKVFGVILTLFGIAIFAQSIFG